MRMRHYYTVDRIEQDLVVLIDDEGTGYAIPPGMLPLAAREGMVVTVRTGASGQPDWGSAERSEAEERRRLEEGSARLDRLERRDPGGDVEL